MKYPQPMMNKVEKKVLDWLQSNYLVIILMICIMASFAMRYGMRTFVSKDMETYLIPWYDEIRNGGGVKYLYKQVGNYNILYQIFIAISTYLPIKPLYAIKGLSIGFDYLLGIIVAWFAWKNTEKNITKTIMMFAITINLPMVFINSALWGQCDSIYCFFCLLSVAFCLEKKTNLCFVSYGIAFAFKLQSIFLLPFFLYQYTKEKTYSIWKFLIIPISMVFLSLPAIIQGRPFLDTFSIYKAQANEYKRISLNYPSFWNLLFLNENEQYFDVIKKPAIIFTAIVLLIEMIYFGNSNQNNMRVKLKQCFFLTYTCVLFLPSMHERYDYLYLILGLVIAITDPKTIILYCCLTILNLKAYSDFLFDTPQCWELLSVANVMVFAGYALLLFGTEHSQASFK